MNPVEVILWGKLVGILIWDAPKGSTAFEYAPEFIRGNLELSPLINPRSSKVIKAKAVDQDTDSSFDFDTSKGLPLFISDSLPDKFGTELFAKYLEKEGKNYRDLTPLEKLTYIGIRGMGALEFYPIQHGKADNDRLDVKKLSELSLSLLDNKPIATIEDMSHLFHIGTSPGGAQPKVLINIDRQTGYIYRGDQVPSDEQDSWILKFNRDIGQPSDKERGKIEYAYYLIAKEAGIHMTDSELKKIDDDYFFMTQRFDRKNGEKIHTQTLHAFAGMNFRLPNSYSYEQIFSIFNRINLDYSAKEQLFRIMIFNVIGRNVDDHTKNFGFNMDQTGTWNFSPAYDLTFSYNENYNRETPHFLSINGKNSHIGLDDILHIAKEYSIKSPKRIVNEINQSFLQWNKIATHLELSEETKKYISSKLKTTPYTIK